MIDSEESTYGDWIIQSSCRENKPTDWQPGDSLSYFGRLSASRRQSSQQLTVYTGVQSFQIPEIGFRVFDDWSEAYRALTREALLPLR